MDKIKAPRYSKVKVCQPTTALAVPSPWVTDELGSNLAGDWDYQAPITYGQLLELCPDGMLGLDADAPMSREQVAMALAGAMGLEFFYQAPTYTDSATISSEASFAVGQLQAAGIMNGYGDGSFRPQALCTVEQAVVLLSRLVGVASNVAVYDTNGIETAIPTVIQDQLLINPHDLGGDDLIKVYETASYQQSKADYGTEYGAGFLFGLERYTQAQYEEYLCYDMAGFSVFAKDDSYYYVKQEATDVQFYRSDMDMYTDASLAEWVALLDYTDLIVEDFILRNGLTLYSDSLDREKDYTYDSEHITALYDPYGTGKQFWTLTLSQPVTQGEGGIWCVERWEDTYGNVHLVFPVVMDGVDVSAEDYYAASQADCDAGLDTTWLDPQTVAENFVDNWFHTVPTDAVLTIG